VRRRRSPRTGFFAVNEGESSGIPDTSSTGAFGKWLDWNVLTWALVARTAKTWGTPLPILEWRNRTDCEEVFLLRGLEIAEAMREKGAGKGPRRPSTAPTIDAGATTRASCEVGCEGTKVAASPSF